MRKSCMFSVTMIALACVGSTFAATPVNLKNQPVSVLQTLESPNAAIASSVEQMSQHVDFNQTKHIRIRQTVAGHPVWGADAVVHVPHGSDASLRTLLGTAHQAVTMNGVMYQGIAADLNNTPAYALTSAQENKAKQQAVELYQAQSGIKQGVQEQASQLIVFIDDNHKAHWAYLVSFLTKTHDAMPAKPTYILDAVTLKIYQHWDNIQTVVNGGGFGGNQKMGKLVYDGAEKDLAALPMTRTLATKTCSLKNSDVTVRDVNKNNAVVTFKCAKRNATYNNTFWDGSFDAVNGGYSPSNDALFIGKVVKNMYMEWYKLPVLTRNGKPMMLTMRVHEKMDNAYWDGKAMTFGDGISTFYPLTSLGVGAHEISHGFTEQHSNLEYSGQSGGLNEAFSDMAAQAAEFYAYKGKNSWQIGPEIFKKEGEALRYMDQPSKDCHGGMPGMWCSIDNVSQYWNGLDVHYSSGVFNRAFYLMGSAAGWDVRKAFDVMVKANQDYWTSNTSFADAACGVMKATADYKYDVDVVASAMKAVGLDVSKC